LRIRRIEDLHLVRRPRRHRGKVEGVGGRRLIRGDLRGGVAMKSFAIKFPLGLPLVSRRNPPPKPVTFFPAIMKDVLVWRWACR